MEYYDSPTGFGNFKRTSFSTDISALWASIIIIRNLLGGLTKNVSSFLTIVPVCEYFLLLPAMNYSNPEEIFPIVDEAGNTVGEAPRSVCHDGISKLLHPVVHLHLFNSEGRLYLQKRGSMKDILPGRWDTSVGGHVSPGESIEKALTREAEEELGLKQFAPRV